MIIKTSYIMLRVTNPCNLYPLIPHFYIVKLGYTGVYFFLIKLLCLIILSYFFSNLCFE